MQALTHRVARVQVILTLAIALSFSGCAETNDPNAGQVNAPATQETDVHESKTLDIAFQVPKDWVIEEGDRTIYLAETPEDFPWGIAFYSSPQKRPYFHLYKVAAYRSLAARVLGRERTTREVAEAIFHTFEVGPVKGRLWEPITTYQLNGMEASILIISADGLIDYLVIVAPEPGRMLVVSGTGPASVIDEMEHVTGLMAGSLEPLP